MFYHLFCDLNILWTIWSLNFACLNLTRILFREKREIITLNRENKYPKWVLLFERRHWKKNWPKSNYWFVGRGVGGGGGRGGLFFAGSTLLTKYSLDILQFCKCWVIDNTSFNYTACLNCKKNCTHINQQYLSRIFNLWKVLVTGNCNLFTEKMLIVSFL